MIFRRMNGPLEEWMGQLIVCVKVYLAVMCTSSLLYCDNSYLSWLIKLLSRISMTIEFLLKDLFLSRYGEFKESPLLDLLFFKYLWLKIINTLKRHILSGMSWIKFLWPEYAILSYVLRISHSIYGHTY